MTPEYIVIYSTSIKIGKAFLERMILHDIPFRDVVSYRESPSPRLELKDGTIWKVVVADESCRGISYNIAYVDSDLTINTLYNLIQPYGNEGSNVIYFAP